MVWIPPAQPPRELPPPIPGVGLPSDENFMEGVRQRKAEAARNPQPQPDIPPITWMTAAQTRSSLQPTPVSSSRGGGVRVSLSSPPQPVPQRVPVREPYRISPSQRTQYQPPNRPSNPSSLSNAVTALNERNRRSSPRPQPPRQNKKASYPLDSFSVSLVGMGQVGKQQSPAIQQQPKVQKENHIQKFIAIIKSDIGNLIHRKKDEKWEDYKRYCELARGKK